MKLPTLHIQQTLVLDGASLCFYSSAVAAAAAADGDDDADDDAVVVVVVVAAAAAGAGAGADVAAADDGLLQACCYVLAQVPQLFLCFFLVVFSLCLPFEANAF